ncbi:hypothetical protein DPMN_141380 [Dreissena polymorpha]|uniref:Uncharacterized protein n=1 Tax=Dreissena polymorpha TaxID=45954 RepID=A0A9D4G9V7_DREPO|nr:hypothetical protein DPMN_141380 [Dreissena polymorpha]
MRLILSHNRSLLSEHNYLLYDWNTVLQSASVWLAEIGLITLALLPDIVFRAYTDISTRHSISPQLQVSKLYLHFELLDTIY